MIIIKGNQYKIVMRNLYRYRKNSVGLKLWYFVFYWQLPSVVLL